MIDLGKKEVLGVMVNAIDYEAAVLRIMKMAKCHRPLGVSALAVHGVMTGVLCREQRHRLNALHMAVPDGQPVRWALNMLYHARLPDRVYGPALMWQTCEQATEQGVPIYLYGSTQKVVETLSANLKGHFPNLIIAGSQPSTFRRLNPQEKRDLVATIKSSGASIVFVGIGCPRQEIWAYEYLEHLDMPIVAVGAAFNFHAGQLSQAPRWMQNCALEWLYRLLKEPRRLWRRYVLLNPAYAALLALQLIGLKPVKADAARQPVMEVRCG